MKRSEQRTPDRVLLSITFDAEAMLKDAQGVTSAVWLGHFVTQNYIGRWDVIPLRGPRGATHPVMMMYSDPSCSEFEDTPFLDACPAIRKALQWFDCPLQSVRLMKLGVGSVIKEHCDHDLNITSGTVRFHVPLQTNASVDFRLNRTPVTMQPGQCWYLRLSDPHSVRNDGNADRIHLVIDALVNDWVVDQLQS